MSTTYREGRAPVEHEGSTVPVALDHDTGKPLGEIVAVVVRKRAPAAPVTPTKTTTKTVRKAARKAPAKVRRRR